MRKRDRLDTSMPFWMMLIVFFLLPCGCYSEAYNVSNDTLQEVAARDNQDCWRGQAKITELFVTCDPNAVLPWDDCNQYLVWEMSNLDYCVSQFEQMPCPVRLSEGTSQGNWTPECQVKRSIAYPPQGL